MKINTKLIKSLNPCNSRLENYLNHYASWEGSITAFLKLAHITPADKIWVWVRIAPRFLVEVFAIDCAFSATDATRAAHYSTDAANYAARVAHYSTDAATYFIDAANYFIDATNYAAAHAEQVEVMLYLSKGL